MKLSKSVICLWSKTSGVVLNSACPDLVTATALLSDRKNNGQAFPREMVTTVPRSRYETVHNPVPARVASSEEEISEGEQAERDELDYLAQDEC